MFAYLRFKWGWAQRTTLQWDPPPHGEPRERATSRRESHGLATALEYGRGRPPAGIIRLAC